MVELSFAADHDAWMPGSEGREWLLRDSPVRSSGAYGFVRIKDAEPQPLEYRILQPTGEPHRFPFRLKNLNTVTAS